MKDAFRRLKSVQLSSQRSVAVCWRDKLLSLLLSQISVRLIADG